MEEAMHEWGPLSFSEPKIASNNKIYLKSKKTKNKKTFVPQQTL